MDIQTKFNDLGVNAIVATNLMQMLDISINELSIPQRFAKIQSVLSYFKGLPEDTVNFLVTRCTRGKPVNRLDQVFEYTQLLAKKSEIEQQLNHFNDMVFKLEVIGDAPRLIESQNQKQTLEESFNLINENIAIYEK